MPAKNNNCEVDFKSLETPLFSEKRPLSALGNAALEYAEEGVRLFPIAENRKTPATPHGFKDATSDKAQIEAWWLETPQANIGFEPWSKGLLVVDIDPGADLTGLELPHTHTVRTPRGGEHRYYTVSEPFGPSASKLSPNVDIRCESSYVLLPSSRIKDGTYTVIDDREPVPLPQSVADRLRNVTSPTHAPPNIELDLPSNIHRAKTRLSGLIAASDVAVSGQGGNDRTYKLATELRDFGLSKGSALALLMEPSGWNDHCQPPWSEPELQSIFSHAYDYGQNDIGARAVSTIEDAFKDVDFNAGISAPTNDQFDGLSYAIASDVQSKKINWIWPGRFAAGMVGIVAGSPDTGKSTIAYDIAAKISNGAEWPFEEGIAEQGAVIILSGEDSRQRIIVPRLKAARANLSEIILLEPLVKDNDHKRMLNLGDDLVRIAKLIERLNAQGRRVKMIVIDPISAYLGRSDSYKNAEMRALLTPLAELAEKLQIGVLVITHLNKNGSSSNALGRITDSLAIAALSRTAWITVPEGLCGRKRAAFCLCALRITLARAASPILLIGSKVRQLNWTMVQSLNSRKLFGGTLLLRLTKP